MGSSWCLKMAHNGRQYVTCRGFLTLIAFIIFKIHYTMKKGISENIICDKCRKIITKTNYITIKGKKRILHYCNNNKCSNLNK